MIKIILPKDTKSAKISTIAVAIMFAGFLLVTTFFGVIALNQKNNWQPVNATVTDFDTSDGTNVWTEFTYEYNDELYTYRQKGHSYWMSVGSEMEIYCNPDNPTDTVVAKNMFSLPRTLLIITGMFGGFFVIYLVNFLLVKSRSKKRN